MIPSIFEYLPEHAGRLLVKAAEAAIREEAFPEVVPPTALPETNLKRPPHPWWVAMKQEVPLGLGIAGGAFVGGMLPHLIESKLVGRPLPIPETLSAALGATLSGIATHRYAMAAKEREAELHRAKQEYQDYLERRAGSSSNPSVQSPAIRT